jgi:hypothetical protein
MPERPTYPNLPSSGVTPLTATITADSTQIDNAEVSTTISPAPASWNIELPHGSSASLGAGTGTKAFTPDVPGAYVVQGLDSGGDVVASRVVLVGSAEGYIFLGDIDNTGLGARDVKGLGDVAVTWTDVVTGSAITLNQAGSATAVSIDDVNGTGTVIVTQNSTLVTHLDDIASLFPETGRSGGAYVFGMDVTLADASSNYEEIAIHVETGATDRYYITVGDGGSGRIKEYRNSATDETGATVNQAWKMGVRLAGQDIQGFAATGSWASTPVIDGATPYTAGGPDLDTVNPGGTTTHDWNTATEIGIKTRAGSPGNQATFTITRMWLAWKP